MPPKKAAEPSKKTEMKKKEKIIEVAYMSSQLPNSVTTDMSQLQTDAVRTDCFSAAEVDRQSVR